MQNLSDDELDNLFRKAAEDLKPSYEPAHWKELDAKITATASQNTSASKIWLWRGVVVLLLIGTTGAIWTVNNNLSEGQTENPSGEKVSTTQDNKTAQADVTTKSDAANVSPSTALDQTTVVREDVIANTSVEKLTNQESKALAQSNASSSQKKIKVGLTHSPVGKNESIRAVDKNYRSADESDRNRDNGIRTPESENFTETQADAKAMAQDHAIIDNDADQTSIEHNEESLSNASEKNNNASESGLSPKVESVKSENIPQVENETTIAATQNDDTKIVDNQEALQVQSVGGNGQEHTTATLVAASDLLSDSVDAKGESEIKPVETKQDDKKDENVTHRPRLSIKIALAPDYSSVKYSDFTKAGTNYGVLAEYHFTPHWSIATGALVSRKIYTAHDIEYNGHKSDKTDGDCRIIDIPVNVIYSFKSQRSTSFYASAGFSSYIMNSEEYKFHVKYYGGSYDYTSKVKGENNELFSVVNVSVGVNKQLNTRWAIQLEPFLKQPVKGIGEGNLSLSSLGAFVNLRYTIIK